MIKYRHKETGLFLTKHKSGYVQTYKLTEKGSIWNKPCINTMSLKQDRNYNEVFLPEEFEEVRYELVESNSIDHKYSKNILIEYHSGEIILYTVKSNSKITMEKVWKHFEKKYNISEDRDNITFLDSPEQIII